MEDKPGVAPECEGSMDVMYPVWVGSGTVVDIHSKCSTVKVGLS